ncbi:MAG TPA: PAS domain S-box protein, partial [Bryobacteraceae bacterium]|nr:PAS domain S-box protein [Bryobacteraceae bacterium]
FRIFEFDRTTRPTLALIDHRIHPDDLALVKHKIERASQDAKGFDLEHRLLMPDGSIKYVHVVANAMPGEFGQIEFVGAVMDITAAKQAEEKIRKNEEDLKTIIETIPVFVGTARPDGTVDFVSQSWLDYTGLSREEWLDWGWMKATHPEDLDRSVEKWRAALAAGKPIEMEARYRQADGTYRWFFTNNVPLRDEKGNIVKWYGTLQDIEDRKVAEAALRKSEEDWRNVFENNPTMYFMVDAAGTILAVNPFGAEQLGYQVDELTGRPMNSLFYEADREATQSVIARCFIQPGQSMSWEHRKVRKDGSVLWVRGTARAVPRGNAAILLIAGEDITDRKHAEEKIREQEMELRQILDAAPQHVAVLGPDGTRLYLNRAALDYHGFTLEQWQNLDPQSLFHPDDWERAHRGVENALSSGSRLEFEARVERRDGKFCWFLFRFNPLRDEQGHITRWAVAAIDIEDRKQAEERLRHENIALREEIDKASMFEEIVGASPALRAVLSRVAKVSPADSTVLLSGETGTGKELIARAIHKRSRRSSRAFVSVNCAAIPAALIGSELFGHEKGSFTGATHRRLGRFELAEGGTIFLDEVGELPVETQIALLRVLQEREFERVGGNQVIRTDVRVIAATNRDLEAAIAEGTFRRDLFYRLNVFPIEIPPLRERREDIPLLVEYFIDRYARKAGRNIRWVNKKSLDLLLSYSWPGNVRELQNVIERSVVVCETENFSVDESWLSPQSPVGEPKNAPELSERLAAQEKEMIEAALRESGGRVFGPSGAASRLGMPRSTLESKIRALKIDKNRFKATRPAKGG